ncbi:site-specific integrase [Mesobacillus zeae]|uniref:Site-specific integrase n=2 Tax=Mesobacillus zeae TaxID=1917180 RepID=A0A398BH22_9BACI|nr:site-specific integrase [Mesobacillus zeae]
MKKAMHGRDLLLFTLGINTALRISDLLTLTATDVAGDYITLHEGKTGKSKRIKINAVARKAINELAPADGPLFPSRKGGKAISRVQAYRLLNAAANRAGVNIEIGCHSLRKTAGFHTYKKTGDIAQVMRMLNHATERDTLKYIGITQGTIDETYETLCL